MFFSRSHFITIISSLFLLFSSGDATLNHLLPSHTSLCLLLNLKPILLISSLEAWSPSFSVQYLPPSLFSTFQHHLSLATSTFLQNCSPLASSSVEITVKIRKTEAGRHESSSGLCWWVYISRVECIQIFVCQVGMASESWSVASISKHVNNQKQSIIYYTY